MVTLRQIAERTGVSPNTVSRILNGANKEIWGSVAARATEVRRVAEELGYRANQAARAARTGRFGTIGVVLGHGRAGRYAPPPLLAGIQGATDEQGLHLLLSSLPDAAGLARDGAPRLLREIACDGLIVSDEAEVSAEVVGLIERQRVPAVWVNLKMPSNAVFPADRGMARDATERLIALGHRRIAFINYGTGAREAGEHFSATERRDGYVEAMRAAGLTPVLLPEERLEYDAFLDASRRVLRRRDRPTAVLTYAIHYANAVLLAAALEGVAVPDALSLVTFSALPFRLSGRNVATVLLPELELGREAVAMLLRRMAGGGAAEPSRALAGGWYAGSSLAPPRKPGRKGPSRCPVTTTPARPDGPRDHKEEGT